MNSAQSSARRLAYTLAATAMLILASAAMAGAAQANTVTLFHASGTSNVKVSAASSSGLTIISPTFGEIHCGEFSGTTKSNLYAEELSFGSLDFGECEVVGLELESEANGCELVVHPGAYEGEGTSSGSADIACPSGHEIELRWGDPETGEYVKFEIPAQTIAGAGDLKPSGSSPQGIALGTESAELEYSWDAWTPTEGSFEESTTSEIEADVTLNAVTDNEAEEAVALQVEEWFWEPEPGPTAQLKYGEGSQKGALVEVGSQFNLTGASVEVNSSYSGAGYCEEMTFPAEVTRNNGEVVDAEAAGSGSAKCYPSGESLASASEVEITSLHLSGPEEGEVSLKYTLYLSWMPITCKYSGEGLAVTYQSGSNSVEIAGDLYAPTCGEAEIKGSFSLSTKGGTSLTVS